MTTPIVRFIETCIGAEEYQAKQWRQIPAEMPDPRNTGITIRIEGMGGGGDGTWIRFREFLHGREAIVFRESPDTLYSDIIAAMPLTAQAQATLRQCAAYRRILAEELANLVSWDGEMCACYADDVLAGHCERYTPERSRTLHALASIWSTHPNYRPEWAEPKD